MSKGAQDAGYGAVNGQGGGVVNLYPAALC